MFPIGQSNCIIHYYIHALYPFNLNPIYKESLKLDSKNLKWIKDAKSTKHPTKMFPWGIFLCEVILFFHGLKSGYLYAWPCPDCIANVICIGFHWRGPVTSVKWPGRRYICRPAQTNHFRARHFTSLWIPSSLCLRQTRWKISATKIISQRPTTTILLLLSVHLCWLLLLIFYLLFKFWFLTFLLHLFFHSRHLF